MKFLHVLFICSSATVFAQQKSNTEFTPKSQFKTDLRNSENQVLTDSLTAKNRVNNDIKVLDPVQPEQYYLLLKKPENHTIPIPHGTAERAKLKVEVEQPAKLNRKK